MMKKVQAEPRRVRKLPSCYWDPHRNGVVYSRQGLSGFEAAFASAFLAARVAAHSISITTRYGNTKMVHTAVRKPRAIFRRITRRSDQ